MDIAQLTSAVKDDVGNRKERIVPGMEPIVERGHCWWLDSHGMIINVLSLQTGEATGVEKLIGDRFWELGSQAADKMKLKVFIGGGNLSKERQHFFVLDERATSRE